MNNFDVFYAALKDYKSEHGDLLVPGSYKKDGYNLGLKIQWIRGGLMLLTPDQKRKVNALGFVWRVRNHRLPFSEVIRLLEIYKEEFGNCNVPVYYETRDGVKLGEILANIRSGARKTSNDEKDILTDMGVIWRDRRKKHRIGSINFKTIYNALRKYKAQTGDVEVPEAYISPDGLKLGLYVQRIRCGKYYLTKTEKSKLDRIKFRWEYTRKIRHSFEEVLDALKEYLEVYHTFDVPYNFVAKNGVKLGRTIRSIKYGYRKISDEERAILIELGMIF